MRRQQSTTSTIMQVGWLLLGSLLLAILVVGSTDASTTASSSLSSISAASRQSRTVDYNILSAPPISFTQAVVANKGGGTTQSLNKFLSQRWQKAVALAQLEQDVEDYNAAWIATSDNPVQAISHRRLIALPLLDDEAFDPPMGVFSHGHVQTGDKMSLPKNYWQAITASKAQVPWLFSVSRIDGGGGSSGSDATSDTSDSTSSTGGGAVTGPRFQLSSDSKDKEESNDKDKEEQDSLSEYKPFRPLDKVVGGPLDFRAPSN
jgi:hypothetical protein